MKSIWRSLNIIWMRKHWILKRSSQIRLCDKYSGKQDKTQTARSSLPTNCSSSLSFRKSWTFYKFSRFFFSVCLGDDVEHKKIQKTISWAAHDRLQSVKHVLASINVIWHISETGWVDRMLRFGPFYTIPILLHLLLASSVDCLAPNLIPECRFHTLPLFLSRDAEWKSAAETAALIRNQLAPQIPGPLQKRLQDVISPHSCCGRDLGFLSASCWPALICWEFSGKSKTARERRSSSFNMT